MLLEGPGQGEMTKREIAKLHDVTERYRSVPTPAFSAHTHRFPEWKNNYNVGTATPIPWRDALVATGNEAKVEAIEKKHIEFLLQQGVIVESASFRAPVRDRVAGARKRIIARS